MAPNLEHLEYTDSFRLAARVILLDRSRIFLIKHKNGLWVLPGGGLEGGERIEDINLVLILQRQVLDREIMEETGLNIYGRGPRVHICTVEWWNDSPARTMLRLDWVFALRISPRDIENVSPRMEITELRWHRAVDMFTLPEKLAPNARAALLSFAELLSGTRDPEPEFLSV